MIPINNLWRLPVLNSRSPKLYFIQMEAIFRNMQISAVNGKYDLVIGSLDSEILERIADSLPNLHPDIKYEQLKNLIMNTCANLENKKACERLQKSDFEDDKPSQLLNKMRDFANGAIFEEDLKRLWLDRLPESVRAVVSTTKDLECCAAQADKIVELSSFPSTPQTQITNQSTTYNLDSVMEAIKTLSNEVAELKSSQSSSIDYKMNNDNESQKEMENKHNVICTSENINNISQQAKIEELKAEKKDKLSKSFCNLLYSEMDNLDMTFDDIQEEILSILMKEKQKIREIQQAEQKLCISQTTSKAERTCTSRTISENEFSIINNDSRSVSMLSLSQDEEHN